MTYWGHGDNCRTTRHSIRHNKNVALLDLEEQRGREADRTVESALRPIGATSPTNAPFSRSPALAIGC